MTGLRCRLGLHGSPRSQGLVGFCPRGCGDLRSSFRLGSFWLCYTGEPGDVVLPEARPAGPPAQSDSPFEHARVSGGYPLDADERRALDAARARRVASGGMTQRTYPYEDGGVVVLGPEVFIQLDGSVLSWKGMNYVPQLDPDSRPIPAEDDDESMGVEPEPGMTWGWAIVALGGAAVIASFVLSLLAISSHC